MKEPAPKTVDEAVAAATLTPASPNSVLLGQLIGEYSPSTPEISFILSGARMRFRALIDRVEMNRLKERAQEFIKRASAKRESLPHYRTDSDTLAKAYTLAELSIEPKWTVDELLIAAKRAALLFEAMWGNWALCQAGESNSEDVRRIDAAKERIKADVMWRNRLAVARDVYGKHPLELEGGTYEDIQLLDFVALALIEQDERK